MKYNTSQTKICGDPQEKSEIYMKCDDIYDEDTTILFRAPCAYCKILVFLCNAKHVCHVHIFLYYLHNKRS